MNGVGKNKQKTRLTHGSSIREPELLIKPVLEWGSHMISLYQMGALMGCRTACGQVLWRIWRLDLSPTPLQLGL